jgi:membrane fusion protein (multidrug efflux system)
MNVIETEPNVTAGAVTSGDLEVARKPRLWLIGVVALIVIILCAVAGVLPRLHQRTALKSETRELAVPIVSTLRAVPGQSTLGLTLPAEVKPFVEAPIYARANGYVKKWMVDIGARVQAGQLLAEIDTPELNQELARSRAEVAQAEASLALAKTTATRWKELLKTSSVSQQEVVEKEADLALKIATVDAAKASVHRLEDLQSFQHVTAPFAGVITSRSVDVGDLIAPGSTKPMFTLAELEKLRVFVHVPQSAARGIHAGETAELTIPELPGKLFPAKVVRTSGAMEAQSRTLLTELEVENSNQELLAGSYAQVHFPDLKLDAAITLPSNTLLFRAEGPQVGVVGPDNKVELRSIKIGRDFGQTYEVLSGVTADDRVIMNPFDSIVSGTEVRVAEASPAQK